MSLDSHLSASHRASNQWTKLLKSGLVQLNAFFIRFSMTIVSLHSDKNSKIEGGSRDWGIARIDMTMCCFSIWFMNAVDYCKKCLMVHISRITEGNGAKII